MLLTAHRGLSSLAPENTLASISKSKQLGIDWVEIDVQLSFDNVPVVFHDANLLRCCGVNKQVSQLSWDQLKYMDVGSWFRSEFVHESLPSLSQCLELCASLDLSLNLEIKHYQGRDLILLCERIAQCIEQHGFPASQLLFSSFSQQALQIMLERLPNVRRGLLCRRLPPDYLEQLKRCQAYSVHCHFQEISRLQVKHLKQNGYIVACFTPNNPQQVTHLRDWQVDVLITDCPQDFVTQWQL
ncbi:glycerophosphoryl diester phosphodiesterase [Alginatibacterium sediminis]|uniref:Glycerophosphoryl diester phosphodiesterase n=1 Tax=Alginatibacterium sediminis TaxID=2164068 RepID=A0A420EHV5_9ALTE|nr:glycerophosphodiester phosphodiesterase family protein [Alginatibacterium sediminis]RKF20234.1 glycerophosphoryl diester phosphodiesterase [Alginatibacterium sediminis]